MEPNEQPHTDKAARRIDKPALANLIRNLGAVFLGLALVLFVIFLTRHQTQGTALGGVEAAQDSSPQRSVTLLVDMPAFAAVPQDGLLPGNFYGFTYGISRRLESDTIIPNRPRSDVITYTVKTGDNLTTIAENYGLKPETMLWSNEETLNDNPHLLAPDMVLNILPTDGAYYQWQEGDTVQGVADAWDVEAAAILDYPGNEIDLAAEEDNYGLQAGQWVIIPGGSRELVDWGPPAISRSNPAVASHYGPGNCGTIPSGAVGTGGFVWPTVEHFLSGYHYSGIHRGIDIGGAMGNAIFAADSGVVVYAGWSNYGYGNLIVIDHGFGWQTVYAHLSTLGVACGQSVFQGSYIGAMGSTGNSSGPHLHFEMIYNGTKPNPMDYVQ